MLEKLKKEWEKEVVNIAMAMATVSSFYGEERRFDFIEE